MGRSAIGHAHAGPDRTGAASQHSKGRHLDKNIRNDGRVAVTDPDNPYRYLEIRGRAVELPGLAADDQLDRMAKKYLGTETYRKSR
jgi:hypothetical protein